MSLSPMKRSLSAVAVALSLFCTTALVTPSIARAATSTVHKKNWIQRHPTMTGIGAGMATHRALKISAARKKARGQKLNFAERHPTLTGMSAGVATRHIIKKHTPQ
jgi:hypothetical protein